MTSKRFYSVVTSLNNRSGVNHAYNHQSNYAVLFLLAKSKGIYLAPSRSALLEHNQLDIDLVRQLTNKALDTYLKKQKLIIDSRLFVDKINLGIHRLDVPNKFFDSAIAYESGMARAR